MANVSSDLIWNVTRKNSSFAVKRNGVILSCEPGNVSNIHSIKTSGLANKKSVDVKRAGDYITVTLKKSKDQTKPASSNRVVKVKAADPKRVEAVVQKLVADSHYNPILAKDAVKRVQKLAQASVRTQAISKGKFNIKYGRGRAGKKAFAFTEQAAAKPRQVEEDDDVPALVGSGADEMD